MNKSFSSNHTDLPFSGGAIGYFSYDLGNKYESVKPIGVDTDNTPIMAFGIYDWSIIIDHKLKRSILMYTTENNLIKEITEEYEIVTIINSHDMNSVMEIGEKIIFLEKGSKEWEGSKHNVFKTENKSVTNFVYSSNLYKKVRKMYLNKS